MTFDTTISHLKRRHRVLFAKRANSRIPIPVLIGLIWLAFLVLLVIIAPVLPLPDPTVSDYLAIAVPPGSSLEHLLGTDSIGRDILARLIAGARVSLGVGLGAVTLATVMGAVLGIIAGYFGGLWDRLLSGVIDVLLAFPGVVAVIAISVFLGPSLQTLVVGIAIVFTPQVARVARSSALMFARREFVIAARGMGAAEFRIMFREVLPNVVAPVVAFATTLVAVAIVTEGGLSFLGLGVPPPESSWGAMMGDGRGSLQSSPHIVLLPAAAMCVTLLAINFVAEYLGRRFDIRGSSVL